MVAYCTLSMPRNHLHELFFFFFSQSWGIWCICCLAITNHITAMNPLISLAVFTPCHTECAAALTLGNSDEPASLAGCGWCGHLFFRAVFHSLGFIPNILLLLCWWLHVEARKQQLMVSNFHQYKQQIFCKILSSIVAQLFCKKAGDIWLRLAASRKPSCSLSRTSLFTICIMY